MADQVVDSSVWVAAFLEEDGYHHQATQFVSELQSGEHRCHLPLMVMVETCAAIARAPQITRGRRMAYISRTQQSFEGWTLRGLVSWYDLNQQRAHFTVNFNLALAHPLRGADSIMASLAEELGYPVKTFDKEILDRYFRATI